MYVARDLSLIPTIFHETWWLDIASQGRWCATKYHQDGVLLGWLPYVPRSRLGLMQSRMPTLTHFLGPALHPSIMTGNAREMFSSVKIVRSLIRDLPRLACFSQKMHRGVRDVIAFQAEGFDTSVQFSFELQPRESATTWSALRGKTRNVIRSAEKSYTLCYDIDPITYVRLYERNLAQRQVRNSIDLDVMTSLIQASYARKCGRIVGVANDRGVIAAAVFCVWDPTVTYYLSSTRDVSSGNGAVSMILWDCIQHTHRHGRIFDFDGLADANAVPFFAGFGGTLSSRYTVSRLTPAFRTMREFRRLFVSEDNYFTDNN